MKSFINIYGHMRSQLIRHLDTSVDDAARDGQRTVLARFIILLFAGVLLGINVDGETATFWTGTGLLTEIASQSIRLALGRHRANTMRIRLCYLLTAAAVSIVWSAYPLLYWINQVPQLDVALVLVLTSQLMHAQAFTYRSTPVLIVVGGIPSLMLLAMPLLIGPLTMLHFLTMNLAVLLAIGYAVASVRSNRQTLRALRSAHEELEHFANSDPLTSLANRRRFADHLRNMIVSSKRRSTRFALLLVDLDRFKDINDSLGHAAGDAILVEVGARLQRAVRNHDRVARIGGDEFAILLHDVGEADEIKRVCTRISESFKEAIEFDGQAIMVALSIGAAMYPEDGNMEEPLYKSADLALYEAKSIGRMASHFNGGANFREYDTEFTRVAGAAS